VSLAKVENKLMDRRIVRAPRHGSPASLSVCKARDPWVRMPPKKATKPPKTAAKALGHRVTAVIRKIKFLRFSKLMPLEQVWL